MPQTIIPARNEFNKPAVTQILKLLPHLRPDVLVAGIEITEVPFESIDLVKGEVSLAKRLHALHHIQQPAARFRGFVSEEKCLLPIGEDEFFRANNAVLDDMYLAGVWNSTKQDVGADPAGPSRSGCQRLSLLDDLPDKEVLRHDEQVHDRKRFEVVVHQEQIRIVADGKAFAFGLERSIDDSRSEPAFLALEFEFLFAGWAKEIC